MLGNSYNSEENDCHACTAVMQYIQRRKKMTITCIALDLDQTTLNCEGRLSKKNKDAIEYAIQKRVHIVVASGRPLSSLPEEIRDISAVRYAITSNGAAVYDLHTGECLKQYKMTEQSIDQILQYTESYAEKDMVAYEAFIDGKAYAQAAYVEDPVRFGASRKAIPYIQGTRNPVEDMRVFLNEQKGRIESVDVVVRDEVLKARLWRTFEEKVEDIYVTSSVPQLLEISDKNSGKHSGVHFLLEYLGLSPENLVAFGDGDNDAQLLAFAGVGVAMENGTKACKAAADMITLSNDEDGVAYGIWKLLCL